MSKKKIQWISILQGMTMLCVVIGHSVFSYNKGYIWHFCYGFHMPLFIFLSGGLFYLSRVAKEWNSIDVYKDKLVRLGIPYLFFITFGFIMKIIMAGSVKNKVNISVSSFLTGYLFPSQSAMKEMWFIGTLLCLMLLYPLFKFANRRRWIECVLLIVFLLLSVFVQTSYTGGGIFNILGVVRYGVFFYAGILSFKYNILKDMNNFWIAVFFLCAYIAICPYRREWGLGVAFVGLVAMISIALYLSEKYHSLFSSFRDRTFQIYLLGIYPQMFIEIFYRHHQDNLVCFLFCGVLSVLFGIYVPVLISKFFIRFNLKRLGIIIGV